MPESFPLAVWQVLFICNCLLTFIQSFIFSKHFILVGFCWATEPNFETLSAYRHPEFLTQLEDLHCHWRWATVRVWDQLTWTACYLVKADLEVLVERHTKWRDQAVGVIYYLLFTDKFPAKIFMLLKRFLLVCSDFFIVHYFHDQTCDYHVTSCFAAARWREIIAGEGYLGQLRTCVHFDLWGFGACVLGLVLLRWNLLTVPAPGRGATAGGQDYQPEETEQHSQAYNSGLWWKVQGRVPRYLYRRYDNGLRRLGKNIC